ncbi:hypothetical protein SCLCIDRAFT_24033 [Scleroderma citrinum Foug A]|uniref:Uncharacterized protein n=1 Tax=Scleroderma citrinum Foug A TaxID=1036808 RepID=A0A0C3AF81_9AGAM|nr:hypothetical protein SCLCIDRAFT_24033 [Scleroderma citrinum Foug A]
MSNFPADPWIQWIVDFTNTHQVHEVENALRIELGLPPLHVPGGPEPITPPEEQPWGRSNDLQLVPEQTATSGIIDVSEGTANSGIMDIAEGLPLNAYASVISDGFSMQFVLGMDSARDFITAIHECHRWKLIFLDIFHEQWFWYATVSSTVAPLFLLLLHEALQRRLFQPRFTLESKDIVLPTGIARTHSDCIPFTNAFKAAMSEVPKFMHDYWYAHSKDLLVDIPGEHYHGILGGSMNPSSEVHDYIKAAIDWDP